MSEEKKELSLDERSLMWYYHPNEIIRLLRTRIINDINKDVDLTPSYSNNPSIGVVIGTCDGSIPYVDLSLHYLINVNKINYILIHNDGNLDVDKLKELQKTYKDKCKVLDIIAYKNKHFYKNSVGSVGDQQAFFQGLAWAKDLNLDILVKISRRLIACFNWVDNLKLLIKESDGITFSSYCEKDKFPMRTECLAMNVKAWTNDYTMTQLSWYIKNSFPLFAEFYMSEMAKVLDYSNFSKKYEKFKKKNRTGYVYSGYVHWYDVLGINRYNNKSRNENVLWHQYSSKEDYLNECKKIFGDKYSLDDF